MVQRPPADPDLPGACPAHSGAAGSGGAAAPEHSGIGRRRFLSVGGSAVGGISTLMASGSMAHAAAATSSSTAESWAASSAAASGSAAASAPLHLKLSCEALAYANTAYSLTWNAGLQEVGSYFAAGVNQSVVHGFAYRDAPGATWPGFAAWSPYQNTGIGYSEAWGPRQPTWGHLPDIAGYFSRNQGVLQTGTPKYDLVFYRQKGYTATGIGAPWSTASGIPTGWTHGFATDRTLELPGVEVRAGRLAPDEPSYGAMILGPDQFTGSSAEISPDGAGCCSASPGPACRSSCSATGARRSPPAWPPRRPTRRWPRTSRSC